MTLPYVMWIAGALGVLWFALWMVFASESPADHGRINDEEKHYIEETLAIETVSRVPQVNNGPQISTNFHGICKLLTYSYKCTRCSQS